MRATTIALVILLHLVSMTDAADEVKGDLKLLQGVWEVTEHKPPSIPPTVYTKIAIKSNIMTMHTSLKGNTASIDCTVLLNTDSNPKQIDFSATTGFNKDKAFKGIYELKEDKLKICYRGPQSTRPKSFDDINDGNDSTIFLTLKRNK